ncbi:MAG: type II secretion system F family protein [archaeon]
MRIPFVPFPIETAKQKAKRFRGIATKLLLKFPNLSSNLIQGRIDIKAEEYLAITIYSTIFWFVLSSLLMVGTILAGGESLLASIDIIFMVSIPLTVMCFFYLLAFPLVQAKRRMKFLERDLLFAIRHILIEVRSGVTLFNGIASVAKGGYGTVSDEFRSVIKDVNVGMPEEQALEKAAFENPSLPLRKVIWQISNALKAGSDIGETLKSLVKDLEKEQMLTIKKYGQEMNPWTMMYMMGGIIMPSLGITFLIVMSAFMGVGAGASVFYLILIFILFFQVFYLSFMKTKRPIIGA